MALAHAGGHSWLCQLGCTREMCTVSWVPLCVVIDYDALDVSTFPTFTSWPVGIDTKVHMTYRHIHMWGRICSRALTLARRHPR